MYIITMFQKEQHLCLRRVESCRFSVAKEQNQKMFGRWRPDDMSRAILFVSYHVELPLSYVRRGEEEIISSSTVGSVPLADTLDDMAMQ